MATREQEQNVYRHVGEILYYAIIVALCFGFGWVIGLTIWFLSSVFSASNSGNSKPTTGLYSDI